MNTLIIDDTRHEDEVIENITIVPPVGATIDTSFGARVVEALNFDYAPNGDCRIRVFVTRK